MTLASLGVYEPLTLQTSESLRASEPPSPPHFHASIPSSTYMGGIYVNLPKLIRSDMLPRIDTFLTMAFLHTLG